MTTVSHNVAEHTRTTLGRRAIEAMGGLNQGQDGVRDDLRKKVEVVKQFCGIVGNSLALRQTLARVEAVAPTPATVLILGESGVGKELVTQAIHTQSSRSRLLPKIPK